MKIAFPTEDDRGVDSLVYGHFGSARCFIVVESKDETVKTAVNQDAEHQHGQCKPLQALGGNSVDAVVVGGIGKGALSKLLAAGIKVYRAVEGTVQENLKLIKSGRLPEFTLDQTCAGHGTHGACAH
jgi:predicted Fe-Mo cluster-binding NifX family protein